VVKIAPETALKLTFNDKMKVHCACQNAAAVQPCARRTGCVLCTSCTSVSVSVSVDTHRPAMACWTLQPFLQMPIRYLAGNPSRHPKAPCIRQGIGV
jgi:hypothetical protein